MGQICDPDLAHRASVSQPAEKVREW